MRRLCVIAGAKMHRKYHILTSAARVHILLGTLNIIYVIVIDRESRIFQAILNDRSKKGKNNQRLNDVDTLIIIKTRICQQMHILR